MRKDNRDDLTVLCDELEQCNNKVCVKNEIVCAKKKIQEYAGNDINKQLKLKTLIEIHDEGDRVGIFNYMSVLISVFSFCATVTYNLSGKQEYALYVISAMLVLLMVCAITLRFAKKTTSRKKWRRYLKVALNNIEKEK